MGNPLSIWNFYLRNKRKVLPVIGILTLAILGVVVTDALLARDQNRDRQAEDRALRPQCRRRRRGRLAARREQSGDEAAHRSPGLGFRYQ